MTRRKTVSFVFIFMSTVLIILYPEPATSGALDGVNLCLKTLIPSLFPFMVLTTALLQLSGCLRIPIIKGIGRICKISPGTENLLLIGLLGGYPVGAKLISTAYQDKSISRLEAQRMLGFCNNAGPAFIFGIIGHMFSSPIIALVIWLLHITSAIIVGVLLPKASTETLQTSPTVLASSGNTLVEQCVHTMGIVCGWVILFRIAISYIYILASNWQPQELLIVVSGMLELSNGCSQLEIIANPAIRFLVCNGLISFGGLCVSMQTSAVAHNVGLRYYFPGKILQTAINLILALVFQSLLFSQHIPQKYILYTLSICITITVTIGWILRAEKSSRFYKHNAV